MVDGVALNQIFSGLKLQNEEERTRSALELRSFLASIARDLTGEQFNRYNNEINKTIFDLLQSKDASQTLGGIAALNALIDFDSGVGEENATKTARFSNYLSSFILSSDLKIMKEATKTLGKLATPGGTLTGDFVDFEAKKAIEWLQSDNRQHENRRHAAILILTALSENAPLLLQGYITQVLEHIWVPLRDHKLIIRNDAAITLQRCISIIYSREPEVRRRWIHVLIDQASSILARSNAIEKSGSFESNGVSTGYSLISSAQSPSHETIHGALLVYRELIRYHSDPYIKSMFGTIYENASIYKGHKVAYIRQELTKIYPLLCRVNPELFVEKYLHRTLYYYLTQLKKHKSLHNEASNSDKSAILKSIGLLALEVGNQMATYLDAILDNIRDGLSYPANSGVQLILTNAVSKGDTPGTSLSSVSASTSGSAKYRAARKDTEPAIFDCIGKLSIAVGPALTKHLQRDILDMMFSNCSLSEHMEEVLQTLIMNIPSLRATVDRKLLNLLSLVLSGKGFQPPGSPYGSTKINESMARDFRLIMISRDTGMTVSTILGNPEVYKAQETELIVQALLSLIHI